MSLFSTDLSIPWPALVAGILVAISHVPLGQQVLARGIVFIDLAIAQVAGLGVIAASSFGLPIEGWGAQAAAGAAALAGALLLTWTERRRPEIRKRSSASCSSWRQRRRSWCSRTIRMVART